VKITNAEIKLTISRFFIDR